jgi:hypothetical protein
MNGTATCRIIADGQHRLTGSERRRPSTHPSKDVLRHAAVGILPNGVRQRVDNLGVGRALADLFYCGPPLRRPSVGKDAAQESPLELARLDRLGRRDWRRSRVGREDVGSVDRDDFEQGRVRPLDERQCREGGDAALAPGER